MIADYPALYQIDALRKLWKEAFGDTDLFLDGFFESGFSPRRCRCLTQGGEVLAAIYWFEMLYDKQRIAYLYAVATAKSHRGKGLFSTLLADTKQVLIEDGFDGILLVPETAALGQMYEKFGFTACTTVDLHEVLPAEEVVDYREIGPEEFAALRRMMLPKGGILQEGQMLSFIASQYRFWAGEGWLATGQVYDDKTVCQEFLGDYAAMAGLVRALHASKGEFRTPGNTQPFGWFLPLWEGCKRPDYFAIALD